MTPLPAQRPAEAPPGFEFTGECRLPRKGDWYLAGQITEPKGPHALQATIDWETLGYEQRPRWILRPLPRAGGGGPRA